MLILGIDPGLNVTGYALLESDSMNVKVREAGVVRGGKEGEMSTRLSTLYDGVAELFEEFSPDIMVVEKLYSHYAQPRTAILMGHARGVILLAAGQKGIPTEGYNATQVKKSLTGHGHAPKDQMQRAIQTTLGLSAMPEPHDVADALAVALCHHFLRRFST